MVEGVFGHDVVEVHRAVVAGLLLPQRADPLDDLHVVLEVERQAEEREDVAPVLQVQPMSRAGGVRDQHRYLARVPRPDRLGTIQHPRLLEPLQDALSLVGVGVRQQHRHAVGLLDDALQRVQLGVVQLLPDLAAFLEHRPRGDLHQLPKPHRRVGRFDLQRADPGDLDLSEQVFLDRVVRRAHRRR